MNDKEIQRNYDLGVSIYKRKVKELEALLHIACHELIEQGSEKGWTPKLSLSEIYDGECNEVTDRLWDWFDQGKQSDLEKLFRKTVSSLDFQDQMEVTRILSQYSGVDHER